MANSLRDQLVAAGLASPAQAKKAEKQKKAEAQARRSRSSGKAGSKKGAKAGKGNNSPGSQGAGSQAKSTPEETSSPEEKSSRDRAQQVRAAKARRDKELARERNSKAQARAARAQIKQLIAQNDQRVKEKAETDVPYNFLHKKKIKRIYVPPAQQALLSQGKLVIINNDGLYHLVTPEIAAKIAQRDPKWIITAHDSSASEPEMDEHYKKFEIPDDLDW